MSVVNFFTFSSSPAKLLNLYPNEDDSPWVGASRGSTRGTLHDLKRILLKCEKRYLNVNFYLFDSMILTI
jgi:hypothetical protein